MRTNKMYIPDECFSLNKMTVNPKTRIGEIIKIKALEKGYYETLQEGAQEDVDKVNKELGIDVATVRAMETASMFGWDTYKKSLEAYKKSHTIKE